MCVCIGIIIIISGICHKNLLRGEARKCQKVCMCVCVCLKEGGGGIRNDVLSAVSNRYTRQNRIHCHCVDHVIVQSVPIGSLNFVRSRFTV